MHAMKRCAAPSAPRNAVPQLVYARVCHCHLQGPHLACGWTQLMVDGGKDISVARTFRECAGLGAFWRLLLYDCDATVFRCLMDARHVVSQSGCYTLSDPT